ncbi:MAG: hemolysin family protein, partial [Spirochaetota bacterium]
KSGSRGAVRALELVDDPNRFLSTVQVGITLVGILAGTFGGATIAHDLARVLAAVPWIGEGAFGGRLLSVSLVIVVGLTTYLTLVIGELVPKQLAIRHPDAIATAISRPMHALSAIAFPIVAFLSASSSFMLRLLRQHERREELVSEEEVKLLPQRGEKSGVFRRAEASMIAGVFRLDDVRADAVMTPRVDVVWLDASASREAILERIEGSRHCHYPVCDGSIDRVVGVVSTTTLSAALLRGQTLDLRAMADAPEFVPESSDAGMLVKRVAETGKRLLVVVSEHGGVDGIVTTHDLAEAVFGDLGAPDARKVGESAWLISGTMPIEEVEALLDVKDMRDRSAKSYGTLAGFVMNELGRVPSGGERIEWGGYVMTVKQMSQNRVRRVRVEKLEPRHE